MNAIEINNFNIQKTHNLKTSNDFLKVCGDKGLIPAKIDDIKDIDNLILLAFEQQFTFHEKGGLVIGYDFDCNKGNCSGK